jgi:O-antigen/teichoic acid export membrane protein
LVDDLRRIDRGAAWTLVGNLLNILPALLELVLLRKFGLEVWGEFLAAQAVVLVAGRVTCLGMDKSMLWYLPNMARSGRGVRRPAWGAALIVAMVGSLVAALVAWPLLRVVLPRETELDLARCVVLAIPFFSASEVFIGALQGVQKFHYRPLLRDLGASAFLAPVALGLSLLFSVGPVSLGIGFLAGHIGITALSAYFWSRESRDSRDGPLVPKRALLAYGLPVWLADSVNSAGLRASVLLLSRVAAPGVVGAFGVIQSIWQTASLARRAFETPLVALTASNSASRDEVSALYRKVVERVLLWQIPILLVAAAGGGTILHLISPHLGSASEHWGLLTMIVCTFVASGPALGQQVLAGLGNAPRILYNNLFGTISTIFFLWLLTPRLGLIGACFAQGLATIATALLGAVQIRKFAALPAFPGRYHGIVAITFACTVACTAAWTRFSRTGFPWPAWILGAALISVWASIAPRNLRSA